MKQFHSFLEEMYSVCEETYGGEGSGPGASSGSGDAGTKKQFNKRPSTGLGSALKGAAKNATQSIKNAGKNTAGSQQKRKPQPYRIKNKEATPKPEKGGALAKRPTADIVKTAAKTAAKAASQRKLSGKPARPMLGGAQRPDLLKGKKPAPQLPGAQERPTLPSSNVRRPALPASNQQRLSGTPQRKALPQGR